MKKYVEINYKFEINSKNTRLEVFPSKLPLNTICDKLQTSFTVWSSGMTPDFTNCNTSITELTPGFKIYDNDLPESIQSYDFKVRINTDKKGYLARQCPNCEYIFKIDAEDWENKIHKIPGSKMYCPRCKHIAPSAPWNTKEQQKELIEKINDYYISNLNKRLKKERNILKQKYGIEIDVYSDQKKNPWKNPIASIKNLFTDYTCKKCGTKFSVIGSAFFCPCCGNISITDIFEETLKNIEKRLKFLPNIKSLLIQLMDKDFAENTNRDMTENCMKDVVSSFQMLASEIYVKLNDKLDGLNDFQNISKGSELLKKKCGYGYEKWLSEDEIKELNIFFHKRHLIVHTNGIINENYITRSGDTTYKVGQRLVIKEQDVLRLISIVKTLGEGLMSLVKRKEK